jgi:hypothetical protein
VPKSCLVKQRSPLRAISTVGLPVQTFSAVGSAVLAVTFFAGVAGTVAQVRHADNAQ